MQVDRIASWEQIAALAHDLRVSTDAAQYVHHEMIRHGYFDTALVPAHLWERWTRGDRFPVPESFYTRYRLD